MKLFYTGPIVHAGMLVMMLEKHGIVPRRRSWTRRAGRRRFEPPPSQVFVPEADYGRAHQLFYAGREDEL